jgi:NAD+ kinase
MLQHGRVLLIVNLHKDDSKSLMEEIRTSLEGDGVEVSVCAFEGKPGEQPEGNVDLAFSLGGDGTVLYAARCMASHGVPVLPINIGTLGFIASVQREEWRAVYDEWIAEKIGVSARVMLDVSIDRGGRRLAGHTCLNDVVVAASGIAKIIRLDVGTESVRFGRYRADGLIVATPTGSTAYSVAAGGPILDPEMDAMILNPICPFTLSNRPIVIPSHETVIVQVEEEQRSEVLLTVDGQIVVSLEPGDRIAVRRAERKALLVASDRELFYRVLRTKLNWSGGPDA